MVLSNTSFNQYWQKYFPKEFVNEFDPVTLRMYLAAQEIEVKSWIDAGKPRSHNPYKIIILDDVVGEKFRYTEEITTFATRGRHYCTSVFLMTQYPKLVASSTRTNTDFAFVFFQQNINEKLAIAEEYLNTVPVDNAMDFIERYTAVEESDETRNVLVLDQMRNSMNLAVKVYVVQPDDPGDFVVGCPKFWINDPRYMRLERKGAFKAWHSYNLYRKGEVEAAGALD